MREHIRSICISKLN
jgi:non-canonical poly(A) RNA polymerase PAPD5/7